MVLHIDTDRMEALGLTDREMWLYLTLTILCTRKPWKGTDEELAAKCKNDLSRATIMRLRKSLIEKGLIIENENGLSPVQNEQDSAQNEHVSAQNEQDFKEKEKKQKNKEEIKDITKDNKSESNSTLALYKIILENGYLHPQMHLKDMTSYYNANGWKSEDKVAVMNNWMRRELRYGNKPQMDEQAAAFICDMVDALPDYQESFCDALEAVKIVGNKAMLYVPEARKDNLLNWLRTIDLDPLLSRYRMTIKIDAAA